MAFTSAVQGFAKLSLEEKIKILSEFSGLNEEDLNLLKKYRELPDYLELENNIGPFKIATNFLVNGKDYFVPMELEEPSVVAAASRIAKLTRAEGGFKGEYFDSKMIGQLQLLDVENFEEAKENLLKKKEEILKIANESNKIIFDLGGGARDLELKEIETERGKNLVLHLIVDTLDAMGANVVNTMLEAITPIVTEITGGRHCLRIISNFADKRIVSVTAKIKIENLAIGNYSGDAVVNGILDAYALAKTDIYRASTHNKGCMNGIDAVTLATGNDWRAIEAGAHSYVARNRYTSITDFGVEDDFLVGKIEIPMAIASIGGATNSKKARLAMKILRVKNAKELGVVVASVGLANNLGALSALGSEGIQKGHMRMHEEFVKSGK
ncbi:MAG: hydroxymethylglutaryl-CoA reductase, degradative [Candidatus Aenigmatarchaeota archaeon]|nr:MAG: hydroxymethylglutaryl-CoA reductase, degradative [Candidatus Aenigmarchaeota archaeon]